MSKNSIAMLAVAGLASAAFAQAYVAPTTTQIANNPNVISVIASGAAGFEGSPVGDTTDVAPLIQDGTSAFFLDTAGTANVTMSAHPGAVVGSGGGNAFYPGSTGHVYTRVQDLGGGHLFIQANYFSTDASGNVEIWVPTGATSSNGVPFTSWRFDVGTLGAGTDEIDFGADTIVSINATGQTVFDNTGASVGTFALSVDNAVIGGSSVSGVGVVGLGGGDIGGFNVGEYALFWDVTITPAPSSIALLGLGGLVATRRRR